MQASRVKCTHNDRIEARTARMFTRGYFESCARECGRVSSYSGDLKYSSLESLTGLMFDGGDGSDA